MKSLWIGLGVVGLIIVVLLFVGGSYIGTKNSLVALNEKVDNQYSAINLEQQRRLDLIPNLVASVKGYVTEETTVLTNIANARAGVLGATDKASNMQANARLDVALSPLLRLQESYPNLKGNDQFVRLEDELAGSENRIAVARKRYNDNLTEYNTNVRQFPNSFWAGIAGFHYRDEYFKGDPSNAVAPKVDFSK